MIDDLATIGAAGAGSQTRFISQEYTHTASVTSGTSYTLNHNFGSEPDLIICQAKLPSGDGIWKIVNDMFLVIDDYYGMEVVDPGSSLNTAVVRLFGIAYHNGTSPASISGTVTVRFLCFKLGIAAQPAAFQWSTSEQTWPFEKDSSGRTLYAKEIDFGALPDNGARQVAHGITFSGGFTPSKLHSLTGRLNDASATWSSQFPYTHPATGYSIYTNIDATYITAGDGVNLSGWSATFKLIYAK